MAQMAPMAVASQSQCIIITWMPMLTGVVEADMAVANGAVEDGLLRRDARCHHRPAVRHVLVPRLRHRRCLLAAYKLIDSGVDQEYVQQAHMTPCIAVCRFKTGVATQRSAMRGLSCRTS